MPHPDETHGYPPVLTHGDLQRVEGKIDSLRTELRADIKGLQGVLEESNKRHGQFDVWKATIDLRLQAGVERMNALQTEVDRRLKKETVLALLVGAALAAGGSTAAVMKLLGP